jgi:hypothetical protein
MQDILKPATAGTAGPPNNPTIQQSINPSSAPSLKKVSLAGIARKKDDSSSKYPAYPDPEGKAAEIAARIAERTEAFEALKSALETDKAELGQTLIRPWYFRHYHRKAEAPSSVLVNFTMAADPDAGRPEQTGAVRVTVKEQYAKFPDETAFAPILGDQVAKYFRQAFELKIDGDKLPADQAGELIEKLQQLFSEYGCADAIEAKECVVPVENFKALRLAEMDLETSLALETVGEKGLTQVAVFTKNVRK